MEREEGGALDLITVSLLPSREGMDEITCELHKITPLTLLAYDSFTYLYLVNKY